MSDGADSKINFWRSLFWGRGRRKLVCVIRMQCRTNTTIYFGLGNGEEVLKFTCSYINADQVETMLTCKDTMVLGEMQWKIQDALQTSPMKSGKKKTSLKTFSKWHNGGHGHFLSEPCNFSMKIRIMTFLYILSMCVVMHPAGKGSVMIY